MKSVDLTKIPAMQEASLFSGITKIYALDKPNEDDEVLLEASGWAWAGGGRNIVRVDVSADGGKNWVTSEIYEGGNQKFNRAWAWVFWKAKIPAVLSTDGTIELCSKAVDGAYNIQPQNPDWNVRGLGNNSWFKKSINLCREDEPVIEAKSIDNDANKISTSTSTYHPAQLDLNSGIDSDRDGEFSSLHSIWDKHFVDTLKVRDDDDDDDDEEEDE